MRRSLHLTIIVTSLVISGVALLVTGFFLKSAFRSQIERRFDQTLSANLNDLVAAAYIDENGRLAHRWRSADPRFNTPISGWYWLISDYQGDVKSGSDSLLQLSGHGLAVIPDDPPPSNRFMSLQGPGGMDLRGLVRSIKLPGNDSYFVFTVTGPGRDIADDVNRFGRQLLLSLLIVGLCFLLILLYQIRFILKPLARARAEIADIRCGRARRLDDEYPREIAPLAEEINELISDNRSLVERARLQASNLAHALKNPLTAIRNECQGAEGEKIRGHVDKLNLNINRHLSRVRMATGREHAGDATNVASTLRDLIHALQQIHRSRDLDIETHCDDGLFFRGDQQDLEEILGNLLDNACKWADDVILINADCDGNSIEISITDDGPGIPDDMLAEVFRPGRRVDESVAGQGLGLGIVADIVDLYKGSVRFDDSLGSGTRVDLILPGYRV